MSSTGPAPLISIIVPVYNVEPYLRECLNSIVDQTLREIEVICVNDCSTDGSLSILREYERGDSRFRIVDRESNGGLSVARNDGMSRATGKYLLFVDSDDYVDGRLCREVLDCAEANRAELVLYDYATFWSDDRAGRNRERDSGLRRVDSSVRGQLLSLPAYAWTKLVLSDHARLMQLRFPDGLLYEDSPVHWALVTMSSRVAILPERLYFYRQRAGSIGYRRDWRLTDRILVYDRIKEYLQGKSLYQEYREPFFSQQLDAFYGVYDRIDVRFRRDVMAMIRERLTDDHWRFVADGVLQRPIRDFFLSLRGDAAAGFRRSLWLSARWCYRRLALKPERHLA
jgi:glycosyltransferase involved in cell wall biosynthesis